MTTHQPGYYKNLMESLSEKWRPRRGDTVEGTLGTTLPRMIHGEEDVIDVYVKFSATLTIPGESSNWYGPGSGNEWDFEILSYNIDLPSRHPTEEMINDVGGPLTEEEKQRLEKWFWDHPNAAQEEADHQYESFEPDAGV